MLLISKVPCKANGKMNLKVVFFWQRACYLLDIYSKFLSMKMSVNKLPHPQSKRNSNKFEKFLHFPLRIGNQVFIPDQFVGGWRKSTAENKVVCDLNVKNMLQGI